jgi:hypothetical protein
MSSVEEVDGTLACCERNQTKTDKFLFIIESVKGLFLFELAQRLTISLILLLLYYIFMM